MLLDEGEQAVHRARHRRAAGELRAVAEVAAAAHHGDVHAGEAVGLDRGQHIDVLVLAAVDELLVQHGLQHAHLVAAGGGLLEGEALGGGLHPVREVVDDLARLAVEEAGGEPDVGGIGLGLDQPDAGRGATLDLVQQAGTRAVGEDGVLAGAQLEGLLQQVDALAHRPGVGEGAEVARALGEGAAVVGQARVFVCGELDVGVGLVVAEEDVVARRQALDEVVLEDQGLGLGAGGGDVHAQHLRHHHGDARAGDGLLEVAGDAALEVLGLADVEHPVVGADHAIDAGLLGEGAQEGLGVEGGGGRRVGHRGTALARRRVGRRDGIILPCAGSRCAARRWRRRSWSLRCWCRRGRCRRAREPAGRRCGARARKGRRATRAVRRPA